MILWDESLGPSFLLSKNSKGNKILRSKTMPEAKSNSWDMGHLYRVIYRVLFHLNESRVKQTLCKKMKFFPKIARFESIKTSSKRVFTKIRF